MMIRFILAAAAGCAFLLAGLAPAAAQDAPPTMIVMDGSGSMWGKIGKQTKLTVARRAVNQLMKRLPDEMEVGLMAYGHRTEGDCGDIQVLVKPGPDTDAKIRRALRQMKFQGKTPIADALREAAEALDYEDRAVTVVMVTDGVESCRADPCEVAADLEAQGFDFTAHVIGFGLTPKEGARLACIAKRTGGKYYPARNARALGRALSEALDAEPVGADAFDQADPDAEAAEEPMADAEEAVPGAEEGTEVATADVTASKNKGTNSAQVAVAEEAPGLSYFRGSPVMMDAVLTQVGSTGIAAQPPAAQSFAPDGTAADCQIMCEGDLLCAAWTYAPAAEGAQCTMFDYAAALDYSAAAPEAGFASGMKVGAVQLVQPYMPGPLPPEPAVEEPAATAEDPAEEPAAGLIAVSITGADAPEGLGINWSAIPLDDPEGDVIASDQPVAGPWEVQLSAGEYAVEGLAEGYIFEDYITVSDAAGAFVISGFATGGDEGADDGAMEGEDVATDEGAVEEDMTEEAAPEEDVAVAETEPAEEPVVEEAAPERVYEAADVGMTLSLPGAGTATDAGYACGADGPCGFQDAATGLVFALPPGWASDIPAAAPGAEGAVMATLFGPEAEDGTLPTLILNPSGWTAANGECADTAAGPLCVWGAGTEAAAAALDVIGPSLVVAAAAEVPAATAEEEAVPEETAETAVPEEVPEAVETAEPEAEPGTGSGPQDGTWVGTVSSPVPTERCPAGIEAGLAPAVAALSSPREIAWGGVFDPSKLEIGQMDWAPVSDTEAQGQGIPAPVEGQPPFIQGVVTATAVLADPAKVTGQLTLSPFAEGGGMAGLLNVGLAQCRVTADFELTVSGG